FDPVLHVAAGAVDLFIKIAGLALGTRERGDDEARVGLVLCPFRLRHHPAGAAPARPRRPPEVLETPRRLAGTPALRRSLLKLGLDFGDEPIGLRQPEQKVHAVGLAPSHQLLAREAGVGAQQNAHTRPTAPNLGNDARHLFHRAGRSIDIRAPQLGGQQIATAEHVERQIAVAVVIAVEEPPLLLACTGSSVASRSRMISFGARSCASRNKSTNSPLMATGL